MLRYLLQAIIFSITAVAYLPVEAAPAESVEELRFAVEPGDTLVIENDYGRVKVSVWDNPEIEIRIRKIATEEQNLENIYVLPQRSADKIFLRSYFYDYRSESIYLDIQSPTFTNIVIWGVNPAIEIADLESNVKAHTITGFIKAENLRASSSLVTEEGNIQYLSTLQPSEDIRMESYRGDISCSVGTDLNVRTWLRAGKTLSWNDELVLSPGSLERQVGVGGPLLLATSPKGNVTLRLLDQPSSIAGAASRDHPSTVDSRPELATKVTNNEESDYKQDIQQPKPVKYPAAETGNESAGGGYMLKVDVDWVYVNASVRDRYTNRAVPDLRRDDFEIYEEGALQRIEHFEPTEAPFSLLLLLDVSGSTKSYLNMVKDASIRFTQEIKPSDQIAVATFNSQTRLVNGFTNDRGRIKSAIGGIRSGGGTAFYDALNRSVREYMDGVEGRKAIVVFSDGVDNQLTGDFGSGSRTTFPDLYREIQEVDTLIYTIFLDTEGEHGTFGRKGGLGGILGDIIFGGPTITIPGGGGWGQDQAYVQARREMELIADQTGGRIYTPRATRDLAHVYTEIAEDLRVQYSLGYHSLTAANDGQWREIEVKIPNRPDLAVRARKGYYGRQG